MLGSGFIPANIWHGFVRRRRYIISGAALAVVLILASADAKPGNLPAKRHPTFAKALADAYRAFARDDRQTYGAEFDHKRIDAKLAELRDGQLPRPSKPEDYGLDDAVAVALSEARTRLTRALGGTARDAAPVFAAKAQVSYDCWTARVGARLPERDVAICRERFNHNLADLENAVLPIRSTSVFNRTLAREYLAYAAFKASVSKDFIDAQHFARKGLLAARSNDPKAVPPEILSRWNLDSEKDVPRFVRLRQQLVDALAHHRTGAKAAVAAKAQARFDCWVERASERAPAPYIQKCESEFTDYIRHLKGLKPLRKKMQLVVLFQDKRSRIPARQYAAIRRAATLAKKSGAHTITVIARTPRPNSDEYEVRLALRRAAAVAKALQHQGVRADRIRTLYLSDAPPPAKGEVPSPRVTSQRAEIVIH
jgi:OOP family OmpA-OmpF porin